MMDINVLEQRASDFKKAGRYHDALKIYLLMADGDQSLDAGYLGIRIGEGYEQLGDLHSAKYWYGRAVEENPQIPDYVKARERLQHVNIDDIVPPADYMT